MLVSRNGGQKIFPNRPRAVKVRTQSGGTRAATSSRRSPSLSDYLNSLPRLPHSGEHEAAGRSIGSSPELLARRPWGLRRSRPLERERRAPPTNPACFPRCPDGHRRVPTGRGAATCACPTIRGHNPNLTVEALEGHRTRASTDARRRAKGTQGRTSQAWLALTEAGWGVVRVRASEDRLV